MGLTEAQFIPSSLLEKDEFPGIDPDELEKGEEEERGEHGMSREKARQTATDHLGAPKQGHYYTGVEKAKQTGMLKDQAMLSPTARPTPVIGLAIRGSTTGGLPSGADQLGRDISPSKVGGYDRVTPQNLNSKLVDKTPTNPEIHQTSTPINPDPQTGDGITHPHQIQVTAHEEPQAATGASTDSDDTLKLKSAVPKGIDIDIAETSPDEEKNEDNNTAMIPSTSLSETFERHKKLMREKIGLTTENDHGGGCECNACLTKSGDSRAYDSTRPLGNTFKGQMTSLEDPPQPSKKPKFPGDPATGYISQRVDEVKSETVECKNCHNTFNYKLVSEVAMGAVKCPACDATLDQSGIVLAEGKHKAGCQCGFCKNKGSFGKKKKVEEEGGGDDPEFKEKDEKQWRKDRSASKAGDDVRAEFDKDKKKVDEQQRIDESYAAPFQRMRSLAGVGNMILTSNGLMENRNDPGASKPFNTNWKMDKEKAGFVKIDEEKLNKVKASLERKSKRGTLSDDELELAKKLTEVLKRRQSNKA